MGGFAAMRIAARQPAAVRSLILRITSAAAHPGQGARAPALAVGRVAGVSGRLLTSRIEAEMYGPTSVPTGPGRPRNPWPGGGRRRTAPPWPSPSWDVLRPDLRDELGDIRSPRWSSRAGARVPAAAISREMHSLIISQWWTARSDTLARRGPFDVTRALREFLAAHPGPAGPASRPPGPGHP